MTSRRLLRFAETWTSDPDDPFGDDKKRLIQYLLDHQVTVANPRPIQSILGQVPFEHDYTREAFQHKLLGPLRRDSRVFVGTSSAGIFLVTTPEDADATLGFYTWRVRAELRHARNLRRLAKRTKLMERYTSVIPDNKDRATVYLDESGSPNINDLDPPVFIVAAVVIDSRADLSNLDLRFKNAFATIRRPEEHELKASGLSGKKHTRVLRELSLLDYQWAAACFNKSLLTSPGFADPMTFYRYAFQFLIGDLLSIAWQADLVLDQNSTPAVQAELETYLRRENSGLPVSRLGSIKFSDSSKARLVQLADLIAGAVRRSVSGEAMPLREIEEKMISLQFWPPHH